MPKKLHCFGGIVKHINPTGTQPDKLTCPLWTVEEVAAYLRIKPTTVRAMCRRGELNAVKVGRSWRFDKENVQNFLTDKK